MVKPSRSMQVMLLHEPGPQASTLVSTLRAGLGPATEVTCVATADAALGRLGDGLPAGLVLVLGSAAVPDAGVLARISERYPALPVIAIEADQCVASEREVLRSGAQSLLTMGEAAPDAIARALRHAVERAAIVAELRAEKEAARHLAGHDVLTGIANRMLFDDRLAQGLAGARRTGALTAVLMLDMDRLKAINDDHGHGVGDEVLRCVARRLATQIRETDTVARIGGDEFAFVLANLSREADAARVADKLLAALSRPIVIQGREFQTGASIGIAVLGRDGHDPQALLASADRAMYEAKRGGGSRYLFHTFRMNGDASERLRSEAHLAGALERGHLRLEYQPLVDLDGLGVVGAEALLRWQEPGAAPRRPADFLPLAQETGQIVAIGEWVLRAACRESRSWATAGSRFRVAVNVSAKELRGGGLERAVAAALQESGLAAERLTLEFDEAVLIEESAPMLRTLAALRDRGVRVAIDDFGRVHAPVASLRRVPFDEVKLAPTLIHGLPGDAVLEGITAAIIALARRLGAVCTAKSVETFDQLTFLREAGCEFAQGFLFSEPVVPQDLPRLLAARLPEAKPAEHR